MQGGHNKVIIAICKYMYEGPAVAFMPQGPEGHDLALISYDMYQNFCSNIHLFFGKVTAHTCVYK